MSRSVKISYVILTKNSGKTLRATLESIKRQVLYKEIIVVDTHSYDDTLLIAREFNCTILEDVSGNLAIARNYGITHTLGEYIAFVDSDAILFNGWDKRMVALLREDNVAGVGANCLSVGLSPIEMAQNDVVIRHKGIIDTSSIATMNAMYSRERIGDTRFDPSYSRASEDVDFNFQLRAKGFKLLFDAERFIRHHNPTTVLDLMKKYYTYGRWSIKPYKKHPQERNKIFQLRVLYMIALVFNFVVTIFYPPWFSLLFIQLLVPFLVYLYLTLNFYTAYVNAMKFYANVLGMIRSLV